MFGLVSKKKYIEEVERNEKLKEEVIKTELNIANETKRLNKRCEEAASYNRDLRTQIKKHKEVIDFKNSCITGLKNTIKALKKREENLLNLKQEEFTNAAKEELINKLEDFRNETRREMFKRIDSTGYIKVVNLEDEMRQGIEIVRLNILEKMIKDFRSDIEESIKDTQQKLLG